MPTIFTIGHSNRSPETVLDMLTEVGVDLLADVRAFPRSRTNPAFNIDTFPAALDEQEIEYRHFEKLGGRRKKQPSVYPAVNRYWRVQSFHNYADYALGDEFKSALGEIENLASDRHVALMCSEAVWWRCHRRIIADYLMARGHHVCHLMAPGRQEPGEMTDGAVRRSADEVIYPEAKIDQISTGLIPLCRHERLAIRENELRARRADQETRSRSSPEDWIS